MGCDIHLYVERKIDGQWQSADKWELEDADDAANSGRERRMTIDWKERFYSSRNYDLFSILANVRNGRGFAGVKTGDRFIPICEPRGLPNDVTDLVKSESDHWDCDGHSHSHFTVAELLAYDWTQITKHCGWLSALEFWRWNRWPRSQGEGPESYCGDVGGGSVKHISEDRMAELLKPLGNGWDAEPKITEDESLKSMYCRCEWELPYFKSCREFLSETMPRLWHLGKPEDVRIVFWFDN